MNINIDMNNITTTDKLILNIKQDGYVRIHKNINNVSDIKKELMKIIGDLEWKTQ